MNEVLAWNAVVVAPVTLIKAYSAEPLLIPVAEAVIEVVPPLHKIVPAEPAAAIVHGTAAVTVTDEVGLSSAVTLPDGAGPDEVQSVPLPKPIEPAIPTFDPTVTPLAFRIIVVFEFQPIVVPVLLHEAENQC